MDAAVGVVECGSWAVKDAVNEIPWRPNGPIPVQVDGRLLGYERVRYPADVPATTSAVDAGEAVADEAVAA